MNQATRRERVVQTHLRAHSPRSDRRIRLAARVDVRIGQKGTRFQRPEIQFATPLYG